MKELYSHEFNRWQKILAKVTGMRRINTDSIDFKWGYFAPRAGFELMLHRGGYFTNRYSVSICLGWGHFCINLPFKTKLAEGCSLPQYGIAIHNSTFWIHTGGDHDESWGQVTGNQWITWDLPFFTWEFQGHWIQKNDEFVLMQKNMDAWDFRKCADQYVIAFQADDGKGCARKVTAVYTIEKRQWHLKWLPFIKKQHLVADINFDKEVGGGIDSYKGGTIGTSVELSDGVELADKTVRKFLLKYE